jgi:hypothetical protein
MEPIIILALLIALGLLALRRGADSRDRSPTGEERCAALGMTWDGPPAGGLGSRRSPGGRRRGQRAPRPLARRSAPGRSA